jgi:hypothetical protein
MMQSSNVMRQTSKNGCGLMFDVLRLTQNKNARSFQDEGALVVPPGFVTALRPQPP